MVTVKIEQIETQQKKFPLLLATDSKFIILATGETVEGYSGFVLTKNEVWEAGEHRPNWDKDEFKLFDGIITLKNNVS